MKQPINQEEAPVSPYGVEVIEDEDVKKIIESSEDNVRSCNVDEHVEDLLATYEQVEQNGESKGIVVLSDDDDNAVEVFVESKTELLETLQSLFKFLFEQFNEPDEMLEMERHLKCCLAIYDDNEMLMIEEKTYKRGKGHTSKSLLSLADFFLKLGNLRVASGIVSGAGTLAIREFIHDHQLKIELSSRFHYRQFTRALSRKLGLGFLLFEMSHIVFYSNEHSAKEVKDAITEATEFFEKLQKFLMSDEFKMKLEMANFETDEF